MLDRKTTQLGTTIGTFEGNADTITAIGANEATGQFHIEAIQPGTEIDPIVKTEIEDNIPRAASIEIDNKPYIIGLLTLALAAFTKVNLFALLQSVREALFTGTNLVGTKMETFNGVSSKFGAVIAVADVKKKVVYFLPKLPTVLLAPIDMIVDAGSKLVLAVELGGRQVFANSLKKGAVKSFKNPWDNYTLPEEYGTTVGFGKINNGRVLIATTSGHYIPIDTSTGFVKFDAENMTVQVDEALAARLGINLKTDVIAGPSPFGVTVNCYDADGAKTVKQIAIQDVLDSPLAALMAWAYGDDWTTAYVLQSTRGPTEPASA